jgi:hypothetical protein
MAVKWFERQRTTDRVISIGEIERGIARQRTTNPSFAGALGEVSVSPTLYVTTANVPRESAVFSGPPRRTYKLLQLE